MAVTQPRITTALVIVGLASAMHLDWHVARPEVHHLSLGWRWHWLLGVPAGALTAWFVSRARSDRRLGASLVIFGSASVLAAIVEPAWEYWLDAAPFDWAFGPERWRIFFAFLAAALVTHAAVLATTRTAVVLVFASVFVATPAADTQEHTWRWYSRGGLEIEMRNDWMVPNDAPWSFRSTRGLGHLSFDRWLPIRDSWYTDFDDWVARKLVLAKELYEISALMPGTVSGFRALTYAGKDGSLPSKPTIRETWIGVPNPPGGAIFSVSLSSSAQGRDLDDTLRVYERMVGSMRLHPAALDTHMGGKWAGPLPEGSHTNPYRASVVDLAAWLGDVGGDRPVIEVDPRILVTGGRGLPLTGDAVHTPESLAGVSLDNMVVIMTLDRARQCTGVAASTCRKDGRFVAVAFDLAAIKGDTATVTAFVRVSRPPTDAELARMQASSNASAALARFGQEAGSATLFKLTLTRLNRLWSVTNRAIIGQT